MPALSVTEARVGRLPSPTLEPQVAPLPPDEGLPGLQHLFDAEWVWQAFCSQFGPPQEAPERLRLRQLTYRPGERAVAGYVAERPWGRWVSEDQFAVELAAGEPERLFRYPDDPYLPGLSLMASATDAQDLLPKYVPLHPQRLHVEQVRYRPTSRAVLRHRLAWRRSGTGEVTLYVRVMRPKRVKRLLAAAELAEHSGFGLPRLAGAWPEGGVAWLAGSPGETVRALIRKGTPPDPESILDGLAPLWATPLPAKPGRALDLAGGFRLTEGVLTQVLQDEGALQALRLVADSLRPFTQAWRPTALAHNDFYDDQLLLAPTGRLVLVDFEETGPGDPLLDIGNMLAHLRWMARFGKAAEPCTDYRDRFRAAALERFGWEERDLALREAYALFRLSSNPVRQLLRDWPAVTQGGLALVSEALEGAS